MGCGLGGGEPDIEAEFFDDFDYRTHAEAEARGWWIRGETHPGGPGCEEGRWDPALVEFASDPDLQGNRIVRLHAWTKGTCEDGAQSQIGTVAEKFREGTYAARIRFTDAPLFGAPAQPTVQAFFTYSHLRSPCDPLYSECDFEYLPVDTWNGCGGVPCLYLSTWETVGEIPWIPCLSIPDDMSTARPENLAGWRICSLRVLEGRVEYFVDDRLVASHGGDHYPDSPMAILFQHWFDGINLTPSADVQEYVMDIDWVYFAQGVLLSPSDVRANVSSCRALGISFRDEIEDPATPPAARFLRGDVNADGRLDIADPISALEFLFGSDDLDCPETADAQDDGELDVADPIHLLSYLFASGSAPPSPFGDCGWDPTPDAVGCTDHGPCR